MSRTEENPIAALPPELLGHIISQASLDDPSAPLRLSKVSRTFYHVAMSTPGAWSKLSLRVKNPSEMPISTFDDTPWPAILKTETWFQRAGACLVDVDLDIQRAVTRIFTVPRHDAAVGGEDQLVEGECGVMLLSHVLSRFRHRIRSLTLRTMTPEDAHTFIDSMYPLQSTESHFIDLPLESLTLIAEKNNTSRSHSDSHAENGSTLKLRRPSTESITDVLNRNSFFRLEHLKFVNHSLPLAAATSSESATGSELSLSPSQSLLFNVDTGLRLRSLSITYPLRFSPIQLVGLLDALRAAPGLERLTVEGRTNAGDILHHHQGTNHGYGPVDLFVAPTSAPLVQLSVTPTSAIYPSTIQNSASVPSTPTRAHSPALTSHTDAHSHIVALPALRVLSLKVNNLPAVLSSLVLPSLRELKIDDMDAKRRGAARETAQALRGLIVRGEMPLSGVDVSARGIEVLEMRNIALGQRPAGDVSSSFSVPSPHVETPLRPPFLPLLPVADAHEDTEVAALWKWCFRRLSHLRELRAANMDAVRLFGHLLPEFTVVRIPTTTDVLPHLELLQLTDCQPVVAGLGPAAEFAAFPSGDAWSAERWYLIRAFTLSRPNVVVREAMST